MVALICKEDGNIYIGDFSRKIESKEFDAEKDIYFYGAVFIPIRAILDSLLMAVQGSRRRNFLSV